MLCVEFFWKILFNICKLVSWGMVSYVFVVYNYNDICMAWVYGWYGIWNSFCCWSINVLEGNSVLPCKIMGCNSCLFSSLSLNIFCGNANKRMFEYNTAGWEFWAVKVLWSFMHSRIESLLCRTTQKNTRYCKDDDCNLPQTLIHLHLIILTFWHRYTALSCAVSSQL